MTRIPVEEITLCTKCGIPYSEHVCYWAPCKGCPDGHASFHKTITESREWCLWEKEQIQRMKKWKTGESGVYDFDESRECGNLSENHWNDFVKFIRSLP